MSPVLPAPDPADAAFLGHFHRITDEAALVDGYRPFNEQAMFDLSAGLRTALLITADTAESGPAAIEALRQEPIDGAVVGAAIVGQGELDLVIHPLFRELGHARAALEEILTDAPADLTAWSHGDHPGARKLATRYGFVAVRTLLQLHRPLTNESTNEAWPVPVPTTTTIEPFRLGVDEAEWVALNALVFAQHPEQGAISEGDLAARAAESWFDPDDFLLARDAAGKMIGYNWLKIEDDSDSEDRVGEIYVIGVHPDAAGRGLGRALVQAGLERLSERGCVAADLYVEADSAAAVHLYRSLGFVDRTIDVQYSRLSR